MRSRRLLDANDSQLHSHVPAHAATVFGLDCPDAGCCPNLGSAEHVGARRALFVGGRRKVGMMAVAAFSPEQPSVAAAASGHRQVASHQDHVVAILLLGPGTLPAESQAESLGSQCVEPQHRHGSRRKAFHRTDQHRGWPQRRKAGSTHSPAGQGVRFGRLSKSLRTRPAVPPGRSLSNSTNVSFGPTGGARINAVTSSTV